MKIWFNNGKEYEKNSLDDPFMRGFNTNLFLRNSCYSCKFANSERVGDMTIGDFWGLGTFEYFPYSVEGGISFVMVNSEKGQCMVNKLAANNSCKFVERSFIEAARKNHTLTSPMKYNRNRKKFFDHFDDHDFIEITMPLTNGYYYRRKINDLYERMRRKIIKMAEGEKR